MGTFRQGLMAVLFVATVVLLAGPAAADDKDTCSNESGDVAIAACSRAIASGGYQGSNLAALFNNRGSEYDNKGEYDRAIQDYDRAIRIKPTAGVFGMSADIHLRKGEYDRAIADASAAIRLDPKNDVSAVAFNIRGDAYRYKRDYDRTIADYSQAILLVPYTVAFLRNRANTLFLAGKYDMAIADYEALMRLSPRAAADALYGRGMAKLKKGDVVDGNADIAAAKQMNINIAQEFAKFGIQP